MKRYHGSWWNDKIETIYIVTIGVLFQKVSWGVYGTPNYITLSSFNKYRRYNIPKTRIRRTGSYKRRKEQWVYEDFHCMVGVRL